MDEFQSKKEMLINERITEERIKERSSKLEALSVRELNDLDDVVITSPANGHILKYVSANSRWENSAP